MFNWFITISELICVRKTTCVKWSQYFKKYMKCICARISDRGGFGDSVGHKVRMAPYSLKILSLPSAAESDVSAKRGHSHHHHVVAKTSQKIRSLCPKFYNFHPDYIQQLYTLNPAYITTASIVTKWTRYALTDTIPRPVTEGVVGCRVSRVVLPEALRPEHICVSAPVFGVAVCPPNMS